MLRELDHRSAEAGRLAVSLDWDDTDGQVILTVATPTRTESVAVPQTEARQAFVHPFVYLG